MDPNYASTTTAEINKKIIHSQIVNEYKRNRNPNKLLGEIPPEVDKSEETLPRDTRRTLAQLRSGHCPKLYAYMNKIDPHTYPNNICPLCKNPDETHDTLHLFRCPKLHASKGVISLWTHPVYAVSLLSRWRFVGGLA
jgi:hypothetical protein